MRRYVIERDLQGAGSLSAEQLMVTAQQSNAAIGKLGGVQWVRSQITADRIYCDYLADSEDAVRSHAACAGLPANKVSEVKRVVDPLAAFTTEA